MGDRLAFYLDLVRAMVLRKVYSVTYDVRLLPTGWDAYLQPHNGFDDLGDR
jgi:hypothetical protein